MTGNAGPATDRPSLLRQDEKEDSHYGGKILHHAQSELLLRRGKGVLEGLVRADTTFSKTRPLRIYAPPMNDFEIFMNCAISRLKGNPSKLYCMNGTAHEMNEDDINLLMHLQSAYEHTRRNEPNMTEVARTYKKAAVASLSTYISEYEIPKIALVSPDWKEGATSVLTSEDIAFDVYDDGRILCLTKDIDAIRNTLKEVGVHVRRI